MPQRTIRGSGLGAVSSATSEGVELAPRQNIGFDCPNGHHFDVVFAEEAELPTQWECSRCGAVAVRSDGAEATPEPGKATRTHWDMLRERRSVEELDDLLAERLGEIRSTKH